MTKFSFRSALAAACIFASAAHAHYSRELPPEGSAQNCEENLSANGFGAFENVPNTQMQFQTSFDVAYQDTAEKEPLFTHILSHVQSWLSRSRMIPPREKAELGSRLANGGLIATDFVSADGSIRLSTRGAGQSSIEGQPQHWALLFEHPDQEFARDRVWRTNIGVTETSPGHLRFTISIMHFPRFDRLIRQNLPNPTFWGAPALVNILLKDEKVVLSSGFMPVVTTPIKITQGQGAMLQHVLEDKGRELPLLFISENPQNRTAENQAKAFAAQLAGQAIVLYEDVSAGPWSVRNELVPALREASNLIPIRGYSRLFWPEVRMTDLSEHHRHPLIEAIEPGPVINAYIENLRHNLTRRLYMQTQGRASIAANIWDVSRLQISDRMSELQKRVSPDTNSEGASQDLATRLSDLTELNELYEQELATVTARADEAKAMQAENERRISEQDAELQNLREALNSMGPTPTEKPVGKFKLNEDLIKLEPFDLREVEEAESVALMVADLFPRNIVFSEEAMKRVRKLNFKRNDILLQTLIGLATDMHSLVFVEKESDYMRLFKVRRNLEVGNENASTKHDKDIIRERTVVVDGETYIGWQHVKFGVKEPNMLRVYFDFDQKKKRIVITHISTHLRTAGTVRM